MEAEIVEKRENPLLSRDEILLKVVADVTPSRKEVKELAAAKTGASPELIVVKRIGGKAGSREFLAEVFVYRNEEVMKVVEPEYMLKRNGVISDGEAQSV